MKAASLSWQKLGCLLPDTSSWLETTVTLGVKNFHPLMSRALYMSYSCLCWKSNLSIWRRGQPQLWLSNRISYWSLASTDNWGIVTGLSVGLPFSSLGLVAKSCPTFTTPWTIALQAPLFMGFSRQEYCGGFAISFSNCLPGLPQLSFCSLRADIFPLHFCFIQEIPVRENESMTLWHIEHRHPTAGHKPLSRAVLTVGCTLKLSVGSM